MIREMDPEFHDGKIVLSSEYDFYIDMINQKIDLVSGLISDYYNGDITLVMEKAEDPNEKKHQNTETVFKTKKKDEIDLSNKHPLEIRIINEFGGEEQIP
jgi:hypothetical protein